MFLPRYGQDPLNQRAMLRHLVSNIAEERVYGRKPGISAARAVAAVLLKVPEEGSDKVAVQLVEGQVGWRLSQRGFGV